MKIRIFKLLLLCTTVIFSVAHAFNVSPVDPSDPFIRYTGRWDHSTPTPWAYWIGSSIIANFTGTSISATLSASNTDRNDTDYDGNSACSCTTKSELCKADDECCTGRCKNGKCRQFCLY